MSTKRNTKKRASEIVAIIIVMIMLFSLSSPAFAYGSEKDEYIPLDEARVIEVINAVNREFPDANLSIDDALAEANRIKDYSSTEIILYLKELFADGPKESYIKKNTNGDIAVLDVYSPLVQASHGYTLGASNVSGAVTTYTDTVVWASAIYAILWDFTGGYAQYKIEHYYNSSLDSGYVTRTYDMYYTGGALVYLTGATIVQGSGSYSAVEYECTQNDYMGTLSYIGHVELRFYASTFNTSLAYTP